MTTEATKNLTAVSVDGNDSCWEHNIYQNSKRLFRNRLFKQRLAERAN